MQSVHFRIGCMSRINAIGLFTIDGMGYKIQSQKENMRGYNIKHEGINGHHYKYSVYKNGTLVTEVLSSEDINLNNKTAKRETLEELVGIIKKYKIKGI